MTTSLKKLPLAKKHLTRLRSAIKGSSSESLMLRFKMKKADPIKRYECYASKLSLRRHSRHLLITYGLLSGLRFSEIERGKPTFYETKAGLYDAGKINPEIILHMCRMYAPWEAEQVINKDAIVAWIKGEEMIYKSREEAHAFYLERKRKAKEIRVVL